MQGGASKPCTGVVVNDDPTQLNVLAGLVRKAGLEPLAFAGAEAALSAMDPNAPPALIVTDLYMPCIDGWRFCRLLRSAEYEAFNHVPILVVSATFAGDEPQRIAAELNAEAFLSSPVDGRLFVEQIRAILRGERRRIPLRVLIVEDSKALSGMLKEAFAAEGYKADIALTVRDAEDAFAKAAYDVAVLDYYLPDGTGDTLLDRFSTGRPDCVCIMITTAPQPQLALDWMKRGAAAYLRKPFEPAYLLELCARSRRERALLRAEDLLEARTRELRESRELLAATEKIAKIGGWQWDVSHQTMTWTDQAYCIHGLAPSAISPGSPEHIHVSLACYDPADRPVVEAAFRRCAAEGEPYNLELPFTTADGRRIWIQTTAEAVLEEGRVVRVIGHIADVTYRKQAEETLALQAKLLDIAPESILVHDFDGNFFYANMRTFEMHGFEREEFMAKNLHAIDVPESRRLIASRMKQIEERGEATFEVRHFRRDGSTFPLEIHAKKTLWMGKPALLSMGTDITARKRAEEVLTRSRTMLARTESIAHVGSWEWDVATDTVTWSEELFRITGLEHAETAPSFAEQSGLYHPEDMARLQEAVAAAVEHGTPYDLELRVRFKDGSTRICRAWGQAEIGPSGRAVRLYGSLQDITDRKRVEMELRESYRRLEAILDSLDTAVLLVDPETRLISECNPATTEIFGYSRGELIGRKTDFLHVDQGHFERFGREASDAYKDHGHYSAEFRMRRKDGSVFPTEHFVRPVCDSEGRILYVVSVVKDITRRKRAEEEREILQAKLTQAQKMESVGRLAGGVAHDFNNMLGVILGHTEMALERVDPAQPLFTDLQEIREAAERAADITRQLLAFARKQTVAPKVIDLNETMEGTLKMLRRLIGEDIDLVWLPGRDLWQVKVDPSQIDQILANLCVNARDAIADVGKIIIETGTVAFDEAYCAGHAGSVPGEYVLLALSDNGCGMDRETLSHIFEPFFTTKEVGKGTGLGMATVYGIVKQNNGFIDVSSEPGRGTTVKIYLPRYEGKAEEVGKEAGATAPSERSRETVLLVEDEPAILKMAALMLEREGYTVLATSSPGESLRLAESYPGRIDLLMTDVVMPEMNGRDLAKNLLFLYPNLKRLFMSGYTADVIAHHGVLDPGVHFIQKPFSMVELAAKIRAVLDHE